MADRNDIIKLAVDAYKGRVAGNFSKDDTMEVLRAALIEANNGETSLNYKSIRDGKCVGLFALLEEIIQKTVIEGLQGDEFFMEFVEYKNLSLGDKNEFYVSDSTMFQVSDLAAGTQGLRRQRIGEKTKVSIDTKVSGVKLYEETDLLLAGRVDLNEFIDRVGKSIRQNVYAKIYTAFSGITAADLGATYFPAAGSYSEDALIDLISHVEAATGKAVTILGTKKALRKVATASVSDEARSDMYNIGFYGKFNGTPMVAVTQRHKINSTEFIFDDTILYVVPAGIKPIKYVTEGNDTIYMFDPTNNADLSTEYLYMMKDGVGVVISEAFGVYDMT